MRYRVEILSVGSWHIYESDLDSDEAEDLADDLRYDEGANNVRIVAYAMVPHHHTEVTTIMDLTPQVEKPLNIKRTAVIDRLKENLAEETRKREEISAKKAAIRQAWKDFIAEHTEQVANYLLDHNALGTEDALKAFKARWDENERDKDPQSVPTVRENELEKFVRVLEMSSDDSIEVTPDQPIYALL